MDTPVIARYYKEHDPMRRKALLEKAIQSGEDAEANAVRKELWEIRYQGASELGPDTRADGYLGLWMVMEFNREASKRRFGWKGARKEILKNLDKLKFKELEEKSPLHKELLYRECYQMVRMYAELCQSDKSYKSVLCGLLSISSENVQKKMLKDIYETGVLFPPSVKLEEELGILMKASQKVYEELTQEEDDLLGDSL